MRLTFFIVGATLALAGIAWIVFAKGGVEIVVEENVTSWGTRTKSTEEVPRPPKTLGIIPLVLGLILVASTVTTVVEPRSVAVQTAFGRYVDTLDNGLHVIAPWSSVEGFTTTIQNVGIEGDNGVTVTYSTLSDSAGASDGLAGGGRGTFDGDYAWRIDDNGQGAEKLWAKYRSFERVSEELIRPTVRDVIVSVGSKYSASKAPISQPEISKKIKQELTTRLATYGVLIDRVSITSIANDGNTQASLDKIIAAQNDIRRAAEEQRRAKIDSQTAKIRQQTGALSPEANRRYCLEIVNSWDQAKNGPLPATFICQSGSTAPVTVGSVTK